MAIDFQFLADEFANFVAPGLELGPLVFQVPLLLIEGKQGLQIVITPALESFLYKGWIFANEFEIKHGGRFGSVPQGHPLGYRYHGQCRPTVPQLIRRHLAMATFQLQVPTIACEHCVNTITSVIQTADPTAVVSGDPSTKSLTVETMLSEVDLRAAIVAAGHEPA